MITKKTIISALLAVCFIASLYIKNFLDNSYGLKQTEIITITHYQYQKLDLDQNEIIEEVLEIKDKNDRKSLENPLRLIKLFDEEEGCACLFIPYYKIDYHNGFILSLESLNSTRISYQDDKGHQGVMEFPEKYLENLRAIINKNSNINLESFYQTWPK
jgi:hypothetical protein